MIPLIRHSGEDKTIVMGTDQEFPGAGDEGRV